VRSPLRIGLTGGIASGKSTVAQRFAELGVPVIDADLAAREVVVPGSPGLAAVTARFGADVLLASGELDRPGLRALVFADPAARRDLEAIVHPLIRSAMQRHIALAAGPYLVLVVPLLVESLARGQAAHGANRILVVDMDEAAQLARLRARDGSSETEARAILAAQASRAERLARADDVLRNDGSVADLRDAVDGLHRRYLQLAATLRPGADADFGA
jgi:dephospho-CoA kinase